jgi:transposase
MAAVEAYKGRQADLVVAQALELYEQGQEIEQAAATLNVPARTIYRWLASIAQDKWTEAQRGRLVADYEKARKHRDSASNTLDVLQQTLETEGVKEAAERNWRLAHAREVLRAADTALDHQKWLLERLLKRIYGQETAPGSGERVSIVLNIGVADTPRQVIDMPDTDHNP